jgi:hypothetical protein
MFAIMDKELKGYIISPNNNFGMDRDYDRDKRRYVDKDCLHYGAVLVETSPVQHGINFSIEYQSCFIKYTKKPKFRNGCFEWIGLTITIRIITHEEYFRTVKDHLKGVNYETAQEQI